MNSSTDCRFGLHQTVVFLTSDSFSENSQNLIETNMKILYLCTLHIALVINNPVQDNIKSQKHDYTCDYLKHHLEFLEDATTDCTKKDFDVINGINEILCLLLHID